MRKKSKGQKKVGTASVGNGVRPRPKVMRPMKKTKTKKTTGGRY